MVDNFKLIRSYIEKEINGGNWKDGDCFYLQLLRRQADDPLIDGKKDKKYHGNMHSRSIKDYLVKDLQHLDDIEDDVKTFCKTFNVRAYIRLNKRSYKTITTKILKHIAEQVDSGETYASPYHLIASACGLANCAGKNKTWLLDLDKEYLPYETEIIDMICQCMPISAKIQEIYDTTNAEIHSTGNPCGVSMEEVKQKYVAENFFIVPTKSGKHIICKPFNRCTFSHVPNANEIKKAKDAGTKPRFGLWEQFCKSKGIELKCMDIHKDNPTLIFCP